jgi:hypothetical protein
MLHFSRLIIPLLAALPVSSAAFAATVQPIQGNVLINRGAGYQSVTQQIVATVGDAVMVSKDGSALVVYDDQCSISVKPGNVVTVAAVPPCQKTARLASDAERMNLGGRPCGDKGFCEPPPEDRSWSPLAVIGAAAAVAGGLCVAGQVICENGASP